MTSIQPTRRAVARGAVWTLPAVAMAVSAPAHAASGGCLTTQYAGTFSGTVNGQVTPTAGCCLEAGQVITVTFYNASTTTTVRMSNNNSGSLWASSATSVMVAPGATGTLTYTYVGGTQCSGTVGYNTYLDSRPAGSVFTSTAANGDTWTHTY